jgi:LCP family protein required for cell wall assembly
METRKDPFDTADSTGGEVVDPLADTQPTGISDSLSDYQPVWVGAVSRLKPQRKRRRLRLGCGCWGILLLVLALSAAYLFFPLRTNIIVMGIDDRLSGSAVGRSDTLVLCTFQPYRRYIGMLSIPRDLWVQIPGYGENRINTAHFFAEAAHQGSGPAAVKGVIEANFGVKVQYYLRVRFDNFKQLIDTMGGVEIRLSEPMSGYDAGVHWLDGEQALAFGRDRSGGDDFFRMRNAQILMQSMIVTALSPRSVSNWPQMIQVMVNTIETDVPVLLWPKFGITFLLVGPDGLKMRLFDREMVSPFLTDEGAQVLAPRWEAIQPLISEMFGE